MENRVRFSYASTATSEIFIVGGDPPRPCDFPIGHTRHTSCVTPQRSTNGQLTRELGLS